MALPGNQGAVSGLDLDANTRCRHYRGAADVIAIKMRCCDRYYACIDCHSALAGHPAEVWQPHEWESLAVLCGICQLEMTVVAYLHAGDRCPRCTAPFNPGCSNHYHLYFETPAVSK